MASKISTMSLNERLDAINSLNNDPIRSYSGGQRLHNLLKFTIDELKLDWSEFTEGNTATGAMIECLIANDFLAQVSDDPGPIIVGPEEETVRPPRITSTLHDLRKLLEEKVTDRKHYLGIISDLDSKINSLEQVIGILEND